MKSVYKTTLTLYPWQQLHWLRLMQQWQANRLPHALLLHGMPGLGLQHFAYLLSQQLFCLKVNKETVPCGECKACQLFQTDAYPDFWIIKPEAGSKIIKIQQIRDLIAWFDQTSQSGGMRIAIIELAEQMNVAAANALLKTLEEPGESSLLILLSYSTNLLPATVKSRCQSIYFPPLEPEATKQFLVSDLQESSSSISSMPIELVTQLVQGAPLICLTDEKMTQRQLFCEKWLALHEEGQDPILLAREYEKMDLSDLISWLMQWLTDTIFIKLGLSMQHIMNVDYYEKMIQLSHKYSVDGLFNYWDKLLTTQRVLAEGVNLNKLLVIEDLLCAARPCPA